MPLLLRRHINTQRLTGPKLPPLHIDAHVVIAHYNEDTSWFNRIPFPFTVISRKGINDNVAPNKGREAGAYLEYIITNYDNLSDITVFIHGHRNAWHHAENMDEKLKKLVPVAPYVCINDMGATLLRAFGGQGVFHTQMSSGAEAMFVLNKYKSQLFDILGPFDIASIVYKPCAQFYVSRTAIQSRTLETYKQLYALLMTMEEPSIISGRIFEWIWHLIFTNDVIYRGG